MIHFSAVRMAGLALLMLTPMGMASAQLPAGVVIGQGADTLPPRLRGNGP
jgi:hypothetical protein